MQVNLYSTLTKFCNEVAKSSCKIKLQIFLFINETKLFLLNIASPKHHYISFMPKGYTSGYYFRGYYRYLIRDLYLLYYILHCKNCLRCTYTQYCNGNASETKANEGFDNGVFFDIETKRTPSIVSKLFSKRSEHIR
jgi:hypothetical protein